MSHRLNRRQFCLSLAAGIPLAFMDSPSRAISRIGRSATLTTTTCPPLAINPLPKISVSRPPIVGVLGKTYFKVHEGTPDQWFTSVFPDMKIWIDGVNQHAHAFELDLEGGWVGLYAVNCDGKNDSNVRWWIRGTITLRRFPKIGDPHPIVAKMVAKFSR